MNYTRISICDDDDDAIESYNLCVSYNLLANIVEQLFGKGRKEESSND